MLGLQRLVLACCMLVTAEYAWAADPPPDAARRSIPDAAKRGLEVVQKAAANYPNNRSCFSCHHQTLPMLAMVAVRDRGGEIDEKLLREQAEFTQRSFHGRIESMKEGSGIGGTSMTVGYGLWALQLAEWKPDETTEAMVTFLLKNQKDEGNWLRYTSRPPLEDSNVMCTVLAAYGMDRFAAASQREPVDAAIVKAKHWLATAPRETQEDHVAWLWGLKLLGGYDVGQASQPDPESGEKSSPGEVPVRQHGQAGKHDLRDALRLARVKVLAAQRDDGGWAQLAGMDSDAYATGQTLWVLRESGLPVSHWAYQRGVEFLIKTQCDDGSWLVETRSKPIQTFFDNGDPHGKHQFISIPATSWAVAALAAHKEQF